MGGVIHATVGSDSWGDMVFAVGGGLWQGGSYEGLLRALGLNLGP